MSLYIIDNKLTTTPGQKSLSALISLVVTLALIAILWFIKITVPNPPFDIKQGVVELDFGIVDGGFGAPDQGGPSETAPARGGEEGGGPAAPQSGGYGDLVTNDADKTLTKQLPAINPPVSEDSKIDPRLKSRTGSSTKKTGTGTTPGDPNGWEKGTGTAGSGPGRNTGVSADGGRVPGIRGTGNVTGEFTKYRIQSGSVNISADGEGIIACRVSVDCSGKWTIMAAGVRGTTYNGSLADANIRKVFSDALRNTKFVANGTDCGETKTVTANIIRAY